MASKDQENLGRFFYEPEQAAQVTGVQQGTSLPLTSDEKGLSSGLQLGSGANMPMLDVATPCTFTPVVLVVTSLPAMYIVDGKPTRMAWILKDLIESHAKSVTGIDFGYTLSTQEGPVGHDGQNFQVPAKTTRGQVSPSFTFDELSGNLVWNTFKKWMWDIQHPDTNASMANVVYPGAYTMSAYAMSMMAIQFDPTMRPDHIIDAAHYTNMFPTSTGDIGFQRVIGTVNHPERTIAMTGIVQHNDYIKTIAMTIAEQLGLHKHNYNIAPPNRNRIEKSIEGIGLPIEHRERMEWANQEGISAFDTRPSQGVTTDNSHKIDPGSMGYPDGVSNFERSEQNWNED